MYTLTLKDDNRKVMSIPGSNLQHVTDSMTAFIISKYQIKPKGEK